MKNKNIKIIHECRNQAKADVLDVANEKLNKENPKDFYIQKAKDYMESGIKKYGDMYMFNFLSELNSLNRKNKNSNK